MWKYISSSVRGTAHRDSGGPCQDFIARRVSNSRSGEVLVVACADGAGSSDLSDVGARLAVESVVTIIDDDLSCGRVDVDRIDSATLLRWNRIARERIEVESSFLEINPRELACTLLLAVVGEEIAAFSQIGDGVIVRGINNGYAYIFWPESGEYANATRFITDHQFDRYLRTSVVRGAVREIAVLTDGLQMLALNFAATKVHDGFFKPMFEALRRETDVAGLQASLDLFLDSNRVNHRTSDDKSLFLATSGSGTNHDANNQQIID